MNDQRRVIFDQRLELMDSSDLSETISDMRMATIDMIVSRRIPERAYAEQWQTAELREDALELLNLDLPIQAWADEEGIDEEVIRERIIAAADAAYAEKRERFGPDMMTYVERSVVLQTIDALWREHLVNLDHLRSVVGFRGYAQRDPLNEYKSEAFELFQALLDNLRERTAQQLSRVELVRPETEEPALPFMQAHHIDASTGEDEFGHGGERLTADFNPPGEDRLQRDPNNPETWGLIGRNEACPCGSGKKFKHCHGAYAQTA
jgi:preprotein translocase subunit SecA